MNPTHTPAYDAETAALLQHLAANPQPALCVACLRELDDVPYRTLATQAACVPCAESGDLACPQWQEVAR